MKHVIFISIIFLWIGACSHRAENVGGQAGKEQVTFGKIDSIQICYLGNPIVHDLDPISGRVLFMEHRQSSEEIFVADFDGQIIASFSKFGDMPDTYGKLMASLRLLDGSSFLAYGYNGFMTYDLEGNLLSQVNLVDFQLPGRMTLGMGYSMGKLEDHYLYIDQGLPENNDYSKAGIYEKMNLLNLLDPGSGEKTPIAGFPETSIFRNGKYFFRNAWDPVYEIADGRIYVAYGLEPVIYGYEDKPPYALVSSTKVDLPEYRHFKGTEDFASAGLGLRFTSGMIENIKKIDGHFVIAYFPGLDAMDTQRMFENKSPEEAKAFNLLLQKKYPYRIAVLDSLGKLVNDFVPEGLAPRTMTVREGQLWLMEKPDPEIENDCFQLYRVDLVKGMD